MVCSACGKHFCYTCGRDWEEHKTSQEGFDFYKCHLEPSAGHSRRGWFGDAITAEAQRLEEFEVCFAGWTANSRDAHCQSNSVGALQQLAQGDICRSRNLLAKFC